jgi:hypothetical protein
MRHYHDMLIAAAAGLALCLAGPAEAAKDGKKKPAQAAHSTKHRHAAAGAKRDQLGVPAGPLYNGQDYLGDDPDPNIRSQILRDHGRYGTD